MQKPTREQVKPGTSWIYTGDDDDFAGRVVVPTDDDGSRDEDAPFQVLIAGGNFECSIWANLSDLAFPDDADLASRVATVEAATATLLDELRALVAVVASIDAAKAEKGTPC